jgi:hypothetical protein
MPDIHVGDNVIQNMDDDVLKVTRVLSDLDKDSKQYIRQGYKPGDVFCRNTECPSKREALYHREHITRL